MFDVRPWCEPSAGQFGSWNDDCVVTSTRSRTDRRQDNSDVGTDGGVVRITCSRMDRRQDNTDVGTTDCVGTSMLTSERRSWYVTELVPSICNSNVLPAVPSSTVTPIEMKGRF